MRLHRLSITAFGPFPDTVEVDFDALSAGGLFLLTGATGAGKTSVLDAVCFALYGQVPGDRAGAKHLRSDHAPPEREPRVVLDLSIGDRRFRFTRTPAWTRPKKRGAGVTSAPAHVVVEERRDHVWTALTNRVEDAGLLVSDLLGMNCTQFTQVAMLPQGRFQAFLRATSGERHDVLQKLFRTDRFERVERWLVEHRQRARRAAEAQEAAVRTLLTRLEESGATTLPTDWTETLDQAVDDGRLKAWTGALSGVSQDAFSAAGEALAGAEAAERAAAEVMATVRAQVALVERARRATDELEAQEAGRDDRASATDRLDRARKAAPLDGLLNRSQAAAAAARQAERTWTRRLEILGESLPTLVTCGDLTRPDLVRAQAAAARDRAEALAFVPRQRELDASLTRREQTVLSLAEHRRSLETVAHDLTRIPGELAAAEERRERTALAANRVADTGSRVDSLVGLHAASSRADRVTSDLIAARADLRAATERAQSAREAHLDIREARINGMAAELAGALAVGCNCPVCGSSQHPAPARAAVTAVGREEENQARRVHEDAVIAELGHQGKVAGLEAESAALTAQLAGVDRSGLTEALAAARAAHAQVRRDADQAEDAARAAAELRAELAACETRSAAAQVLHARSEAELAEIDTSLRTLRAERTVLLRDEAADLEALVARRTRIVTALEGALDDLEAIAEARRHAASAREALTGAAAAAGFTSVDEAIDALLDPVETHRIAGALAEAEARRIAAEATLADDEVRAAAAMPPPDPEDARAAHDAAARDVRACAGVLNAARARMQRVGELDTELALALTAWEPLCAAHRLAADLSSLVEGRSVDNPLRMRLAAFVLAERLRQVVAAANERLRTMTTARFSLEHVLDRGVGEQRGGLSLRIRDDWNGVDRDPATLSGGETFVVSLALALGLADTVAHEAGGSDIDTLFIDEGFGSLDADTLEDVMDTLDTLRDGGRVVGLVSHVPELRSRITTQLEVAKSRTGSTLRNQVSAG